MVLVLKCAYGLIIVAFEVAGVGRVAAMSSQQTPAAPSGSDVDDNSSTRAIREVTPSRAAVPPPPTTSQQPQVAALPPPPRASQQVSSQLPHPAQVVPHETDELMVSATSSLRYPPPKDTDVGKLYPWTVKDRIECTTWLCPLEGVPTENDPECPLCYQKVPAGSMLPCPRCKKKVCVACYLRSCSTVAWQRRVYVYIDMLYEHVCCSFCRNPVNIDRLYQLDNWYSQHMDEVPFQLYPPMPPQPLPPPPPPPPHGLNAQPVAGQAGADGIGAIAAAVNAIGALAAGAPPVHEESMQVDINAINIREQILMLDMIRRQQERPQATQPSSNQSTNIGQPPVQQGASATGSQQLQPVSRGPPSTGAGSNASNTSTQQGNQNTNIGQPPAQRNAAGTPGQRVSTGQPPVPGATIQVPQQAAAPNSAVHQMASGVNRLVSEMLSRLVPNTPDSGAAASTPATNNAAQQETQAPSSSTNHPTQSTTTNSTGEGHAPNTTAAPASTAPAPSVPPAHADNNPNDPPSLSPDSNDPPSLSPE